MEKVPPFVLLSLQFNISTCLAARRLPGLLYIFCTAVHLSSPAQCTIGVHCTHSMLLLCVHFGACILGCEVPDFLRNLSGSGTTTFTGLSTFFDWNSMPPVLSTQFHPVHLPPGRQVGLGTSRPFSKFQLGNDNLSYSILRPAKRAESKRV